MKRLREVSIVLVFQGIMMILFPAFFSGTKMAQNSEESVLMGIILIPLGVIVYFIKKILEKRRAEGNF